MEKCYPGPLYLKLIWIFMIFKRILTLCCLPLCGSKFWLCSCGCCRLNLNARNSHCTVSQAFSFKLEVFGMLKAFDGLVRKRDVLLAELLPSFHTTTCRCNGFPHRSRLATNSRLGFARCYAVYYVVDRFGDSAYALQELRLFPNILFCYFLRSSLCLKYSALALCIVYACLGEHCFDPAALFPNYLRRFHFVAEDILRGWKQ